MHIPIYNTPDMKKNSKTCNQFSIFYVPSISLCLLEKKFFGTCAHLLSLFTTCNIILSLSSQRDFFMHTPSTQILLT
uniref:Putative ovule protein n=1 Tax=Solanum chacoense TaxID=4108 RepID=A0A0V0IDP6_SOLCH